MKALVPLLVLAVVVLVWLVLAKHLMAVRQRADLVTLSLQFPRGLPVEAVEQFLAGISGLLLPRWKRWHSTPCVIFETIGHAGGIEHRLAVPEGWLPAIEHNLQATLPSLRYHVIEPDDSVVSVAAEYGLSSSTRPLRVEAADLSTKLLSALQPLGPGERVVVQWIVTPHAPVMPVRVAERSERERWWRPLLWSSHVVASGEAASALRAKQAAPLLLAVGRIGVGSQNVRRSRQLLRQVEAVWCRRSRYSPGGRSTYSLVPGAAPGLVLVGGGSFRVVRLRWSLLGAVAASWHVDLVGRVDDPV